MTNERVDEFIDRVAAELTAVPSDPAFTARLRGRMRPVRTRTSGVLVVAACAAAVILAMVVMKVPGWMASSPAPSAPVAHRPQQTTIAAAAPTVALVPQAPTTASHSPENDRVRRRVVEPIGTVPPPLTDVETTAIAPLAIEPLSLPTVVDLDPLVVPALEIADLGLDGDAKEPR